MAIKKITQLTLYFFYILLFFLWIAGDLFAESAEESVTLDTVVVSTEQTGETYQTGDVDTELTPVFFSVIEREDFEGKTEDLSGVIEKETGIQVRQSGGLGSFSTVSLRGSSSDQVMVFLDGILLNDASGGGVNLSNISLAEVEAIEIYKGTTPINFGKTSIGGVVNIRTLRSKEGVNANAGIGYGSFNTRSARGSINHKPGKMDYLISADALAGDNDFEFVNDNGTQFNKDDDKVEKRNNAQFDQVNVFGKLGYDFTDDSRLDLLAQWFSKEQGLPSWNNSNETATSLDTARNISTVKYTHNGINGLPINSVLFLDHSLKQERYDDAHGHIGLGNQLTKYTTSRYGANGFMEWLAENHTLSLTLDTHREDYGVEDLLSDSKTTESTRNTFSSGLQDTLFLLDETIVLTPAVRYTHIDDDIKNSMDVWGISDEHTTKSKNYLSPQIGMKWHPLGWLTFKSNVGKYFREPHFYELSGDRGYLVGNPDLKAEDGVNFDVGFETGTGESNEWLNRFSLSVVYFQSRVDDLITMVYDSRGIGRAVNIQGANIQGIEAGMNVDFFKYLRLVTNATLQDTENLSETKSFNGKNLPGRWGQSYLGRIEVNYRGFKVYSEYTIDKNLYYDTANLLKAKDKKELNAGASLLWHSFLITLEAKNIQDNQNEDFNGYPKPGRSFDVMLSYNF